MFRKEYWIGSARELKDVKKLVFAALICAMTVALDGIARIQLMPGLEIKLTFFVIALGCAVYGPAAGMLMAVVVDTLCFLVANTGYAYFPGYMITEVLVSLTYGLFFYRRKITVAKLFCAKVITNFGLHLLLNSLWSAILYGKGYLYYLGTSAVKNALLLPIEVLIMAAMFALLLPPLSKLGLLPRHSEQELAKLTFFAKKEK